MQLEANKSIQALNTFGLDVMARQYAAFRNVDELITALAASSNDKRCILGGGSNVLFTQDYDGVLLHNKIPEIAVLETAGNDVLVRAGAGVSWHEMVLYCVERNLGGIENMSLIPGSVGAAPMQNIGAYGVEIKDVFHSLEALHIISGELHTFDAESCAFGYRESVFKRGLKGQYVITSLTIRLNTKHQLNTSYGAIETELAELGLGASVASISQAVINIRRSKLPDPALIGNAGSFFKNPVLAQAQFAGLIADYPEMPNYPAPNGRKVAAGWLIEQCGWKGMDLGGYGVHDRQALVLVNRGQATGKKLFELSSDIIASVKERYGIILEREVNII